MKAYSTVTEMINSLTRKSVEIYLQAEINQGFKLPLSYVKKEFRHYRAEWVNSLVMANQYDEVLNNIPDGCLYIPNVGFAIKKPESRYILADRTKI